MTATGQQFPYVPRDPSLGNASQAPMLPLTLSGNLRIAASGLVDSGAAINVLPYAVGAQLGFDWAQQTRSVELSGNLASCGGTHRGAVGSGWEFPSRASGICLGSDG